MAGISEGASVVQRSFTKGRGLVRVVGFLGAAIFGIQCISLSSSGLLPFSTVAGLWPGANLVSILTIAMILCLFHAYTYAVMGTLAPYSGADYVVSTRVLSRPLGFAASWTLVIFSALVAGSLIALIPQSTIPTLLRIFGTVTEDSSLLEMAATAASQDGVILIGTICTVIAFVGTILPARTIQRILGGGLILGIAAWGILYYQMLSVPTSAFPAAWDRFMGAGSYGLQITLAAANGMQMVTNPASVTLAGLLVGFWIFYGYFIPTFFAGEVKKPGRNLLAGSWVSLIFTWAIFIGATMILWRLVPPQWLSAQSYLYQTGQTETAMPWIIFYAAILRPNIYLVGVVSLAWVVTLINLVQTYFMYCSRIILAWAKDGLVPFGIDYVHPSLRSPMLAVLIVAILAQFGVTDAAQGGALGSQLNFVFFVVCAQLVPVAAMTFFPFLRKEWFEAASPLVRLKVGRVPVITVMGGITLVYLLWLIVSSFVFPAVGGTLRAGSLVIFAVMFGSGLVWYFMRNAYMRARGRSLAQEMSTMPAVEDEAEA